MKADVIISIVLTLVLTGQISYIIVLAYQLYKLHCEQLRLEGSIKSLEWVLEKLNEND